MLRVGYPAVVPAELFVGFPREVELIALSESLDHDIDLDVWIPDPYPTRAQRILPHLHGIKLVLSLMAGTEWIPGAMGPHVTICNARGAHNISTAELTLTLILSALKYIPLYIDMQLAGAWKRRFNAPTHYAQITGDARTYYPPIMHEELTGKHVLLVGYGSIGKEIERMLQPFDVEITRIARAARVEPEVHPVTELDALLPDAEIVILILPSTAESRHLINGSRLAHLQQGALLVNAARGPVVDTDALVEALHTGRIRAALDVTDPEPLPDGHPLWKCPNLLITPHIGGSTPMFAPRSVKIAEQELRRYLAGEPLHNVVQAAI
jgi:phosphoglycerate dehydrogenase-like enzyme